MPGLAAHTVPVPHGIHPHHMNNPFLSHAFPGEPNNCYMPPTPPLQSRVISHTNSATPPPQFRSVSIPATPPLQTRTVSYNSAGDDVSRPLPPPPPPPSAIPTLRQSDPALALSVEVQGKIR